MSLFDVAVKISEPTEVQGVPVPRQKKKEVSCWSRFWSYVCPCCCKDKLKDKRPKYQREPNTHFNVLSMTPRTKAFVGSNHGELEFREDPLHDRVEKHKGDSATAAAAAPIVGAPSALPPIAPGPAASPSPRPAVTL